MENARPIEVAVIGSGCASIAAAFELTRPEHNGKYHVTVYQMGWRLGGKGASGRGPADRIEEHGLHVWLGFYENAFLLLRQCYAELGRDPKRCRFADWRDAFFPDAHVGIAHQDEHGGWLSWTAHFPAADGLPGDPLSAHNPFSLRNYLVRAAVLLRTLLFDLETRRGPDETRQEDDGPISASHAEKGASEPAADRLVKRVLTLLRYGALATTAALVEALALLEAALRSMPKLPETMVSRLVETIAANIRGRLEALVVSDDEARCRWEIIDLVLAILVGTVRFGLLSDPRGLDAIDDYECRDWLRLNGASERSLDSAFVRGLFDLALAYEDGDPNRPGLAAGQALRGSLRMFFSSRGALFWKMRAGMGDVVFAPFYEVLVRRGVKFEFFHRLENVKLADPKKLAPGERPHVEALEFAVQAEVRGNGGYRPLIDVNGVACWPSKPDYRQLKNAAAMRAQRRDFESHWDRRRVGTRTLRVTRDFDFVVLGVGIGAIAHVCEDILARDGRWRAMVKHVKTVATQAFQIWMREDLQQLGWNAPPVTLAGFVKPFDTWSDMGHVVPQESWRPAPRSVAYFCSVLADPPGGADSRDRDYPARRRNEVRGNAIRFLNGHVHHLWPKAVRPSGQFRWELLADPADRDRASTTARADESRFDSQFWTANVNPSDRYVLALPGSLKYRISPLDNTYDNLAIAGDWTDCGFNEGCVEAAFMSGRLAAHAIAQSPALEDIIGYDHP